MSGTRQMRAWVVDRPGPVTGRPLELVQRPVPEPGPGQVRVRVSVCGVCRTDLHLAEGDPPPKRHAVCCTGAEPGSSVIVACQ
jgi:alcohol dehydrogenase, propanol-preferring